MPTADLLKTRNGRFLTFGLLYISQGIPQGFTGVAMIAYMRKEGMPIDQIGLFGAALALPWAFKWVWAPLVDLIKLNRFGGRKAWIIFCNVMMIITLLIAADIDFTTNFQFLIVAVVLNNVFCATQDVAIDSLAIQSLQEDELGRGNGFMFAGSFTGYAIGGAGAMYVTSIWGFNTTLVFVSAMLFLSLTYVVFFVSDPNAFRESNARTKKLFRKFMNSLKEFLVELVGSFFASGTGPRVGLIFALLPSGAMALAGIIFSVLIVDYGLVDTEIAEIALYSTVLGAVGCMVGGFLGDKFGVLKMLALSYVLTAIPTVYLAWLISDIGLEAIPKNIFYAVVTLHGFLYGLIFGLFAAVFMKLTNPLVAATQFTAFMALANLATSIGNFWQGKVAQELGYAVVLYLDALLVILPILLIPFLKNPTQRAFATKGFRLTSQPE